MTEKKFIVEYAVYTSNQIIRPDRYNKKKSFPTLRGAFGFWQRKHENQGIAHIHYGDHTAYSTDISRAVRDGENLNVFFQKKLKLE